MIIRTPDGKTRYYYYKKKRGRKKKRGPKPKKKTPVKVAVKKEPKIKKYKICKFNDKKQLNTIKEFYTATDALRFKQTLIKKNNTVEFPVRFKYANSHTTKQTSYSKEYVILKKIVSPDDDRVTQLRNEYGKLVNHITSSTDWQVYDKFPCLEETKFGMFVDGKFKKKFITYRRLVEDYVIDYAEQTEDAIRICLFGNKLIIQYTPTDFELVFCINVNDGKRLYNKMLMECKPYKNVVFMGMLRHGSKMLTKYARMIQEKTGWRIERVYRKSTK